MWTSQGQGCKKVASQSHGVIGRVMLQWIMRIVRVMVALAVFILARL